MPQPVQELARAMADAWNSGRVERVLALAAQAPEAALQDVSVLGLLAVAQQQIGRHAQAAATFARLAQMQPGVSAWWNNLGVAARQSGDFAQSERALGKAVLLAPNDAEVRYNLGLLHVQQRHWRLARQALLDAVQRAPQFIEARLQAAWSCHFCGDDAGEEAMLDGADSWPPQPVEQALILASMLSARGRPAAALHALGQARMPEGQAAKIPNLRIAAQRVAILERGNQLERARAELQRLPLAALDALPANAVEARVDGWRAHAVVAMREARYADAVGLQQRALALCDDDAARASAAFGLAAAFDRQGMWHQAWQALQQAHAAQLAIVRSVEPALLLPDQQPLPMADRRVDARVHAGWKVRSAPDARHSPVFVIGFPRSGTTLLEQMLDAHPDFRSMDERGYIHELVERMQTAGQRYPDDLAGLAQTDVDQLRALYDRRVAEVLPELGGRRLVDKNPLNMLCLPMVLRLFPDARIILCLRHPCDVLLSCSMQSFRSPAFMAMCGSLERLARGYVRAFEQCCGHLDVFNPQLLEWRYESVVDRFDEQVARLGRFLDVADLESMSGFARHAQDKRFISTPSYADVTVPVHSRAVGRWQAYRGHFEPVLPVLEPWIERFGYQA